MNNISCLVIGKNDNWKQDISLGKKTNQNFVFVPHAKLIGMIKYKCERKGVLVLTVEESYTSKCSFLDREELCSQTRVFVDDYGDQVKREWYQGKRVKRGLFRSGTGILINADTQGSLNIIRKVAGDKVYTLNSVEAFAVTPVRVSLSA